MSTQRCQSVWNDRGLGHYCAYAEGHPGPHSFAMMSHYAVVQMLQEWKRMGCMDTNHVMCPRCSPFPTTSSREE